MKISVRAFGYTAAFLLSICAHPGISNAAGQKNAANKATIGAHQIKKADWMEPRGTELGDIEIGNPNAKISVIEYASLTCPHCRDFNNDAIERFKKDYVATGKAKYVFRHFVMNRLDLYASMIARCGGPSRFYGLVDLFYHRQTYWEDQDYQTKLQGLAEIAGLHKDQINACLNDAALQKYLVDSTMNGRKDWGLLGVPQVIINGQKLPKGGKTYPELKSYLDSAATR